MEIKNFKIVNKGVLFARFDLTIPKWGDFIIHGCSWCKKDTSEWVSFPTYTLDFPGEGKKYLHHCRFENKDNHKKFEEALLPILHNLNAASQSNEESNTDELF